MINNKYKFFGSLTAIVVSLVLIFLSLSNFRLSASPEVVARRVSRKIDRSLTKMNHYITLAMEQDSDEWLALGKVPNDIVIYKYCSDTLHSWCHEFPISNDDIKSRTMVPYILNSRFPAISPLGEVRDSLELATLGTENYLLKSATNRNIKIIAGLHISNISLGLGPELGIHPLADDGGAAVFVKNRPLFKINYEFLVVPRNIDEGLLWGALVLLIISLLFFLNENKSKKRLSLVMILFYIVIIALYFVGRFIPDRFTLFSPSLYNGGTVFYSIGAILLINLIVLVSAICIFIVREKIYGIVKTRKPLIAIAILASLGILVYAFFMLKGLILNAVIPLELYKISDLSVHCIVTYASFLTMLMSIPLILQIVEPKTISLGGRAIQSIFLAVFIVLVSAYFGAQKEQNRLDNLANRLSFDRDTSLEIFLKSIEQQIADDAVISALSVFNNTSSTIQSRIIESYMLRNDRSYTVTVYVFNSSNNTKAAATQYRNLLLDAEQIGNNSRFMFVRRDNGHSYYIGVFMYLIEGSGISRVLVRLDSRDSRSTKGYAGIFGFTPPGQVALPNGFSYASYLGRDLKNYKGNYVYPTKLSEKIEHDIYYNGLRIFNTNGFTHFVSIVDANRAVVLSRQTISIIDYSVMAVSLVLLAFFFMGLMTVKKPNPNHFARRYYRSRIQTVLIGSLVATMLLMACVSIYFVIARNDANNQSIILDKVGTITSTLEANTTNVNSLDEMDWMQLRRLLDKVGNDTNSDITLYSTSGKMIMSTIPMVFDMMILGDRINSEAYGEIVYSNRRYSIVKGKWGNVNYYSMYATILGGNGKPIGIICSPYNSDTVNLEDEAVSHSLTIVTLFLAFLLLSLFAVTRMVDTMFKPLTEMSNKMNKADLESLEYLEYNGDDEISIIVEAYNRMVKELSESTVKLAQAERDKAWSGMARQVAHEIKNPLTPMKLQLQRIIRLKERNAPEWQEHFDEAGKVLLDHIDILTETANEFSTFAKLYSEENVEIKLDKLLKEEIAMFDNRDNIKFQFVGLENVTIVGPKPQLTRVFVNLINNSVQAIEENNGQISIFLRNSTKEGYYDIVFEDNGPGVNEENLDKLFTPNFTTKSAGSGLGLAISRSVLERCGASIKYSRSFTLGGACFTISYPIQKN